MRRRRNGSSPGRKRCSAPFPSCGCLDLAPVIAWRFFLSKIFRGAQPLHYGFVVALLNDLFGIQVRGGCSCAGPYAHHLLGISEADSHRFDEAIGSGHAVLRPGWVRMNFNYFLDEDSFTYLLDAVTFVAKKGYRFLPLYCYCPAEGRWIHRDDAGAGLSAWPAPLRAPPFPRPGATCPWPPSSPRQRPPRRRAPSAPGSAWPLAGGAGSPEAPAVVLPAAHIKA